MASSGSPSYGGAKAVSGILKFVAALLIIGGIVSAIAVAHDNSSIGNSQNTVGEVAAIVGGAVFLATAILFFAYVLDLLLGIHNNTAAAAALSTSEVHEGRTQLDEDPADRVRPHTIPVDLEPLPKEVPVYPEPGWYQDPWKISYARWWDGSTWTDETLDQTGFARFWNGSASINGTLNQSGFHATGDNRATGMHAERRNEVVGPRHLKSGG